VEVGDDERPVEEDGPLAAGGVHHTPLGGRRANA
jgi:hypothetical protein